MLLTVGTLSLAAGQLFVLDSRIGELAVQLTVVAGLGRDHCSLVGPMLAPGFIVNGVSHVRLSTCHRPGTWKDALFLIFVLCKGKVKYPHFTTGKLRHRTGHPPESCSPPQLPILLCVPTGVSGDKSGILELCLGPGDEGCTAG